MAVARRRRAPANQSNDPDIRRLSAFVDHVSQEVADLSEEVDALTVNDIDFLASGGAAQAGTATLVAGTVTVNTTAVAAGSRIFLTAQNTGGTPGALRVSARVAGTSFTITSTSALDTSTVAWELRG